MGLKGIAAQEIFDVIQKIHSEILKTKEKEIQNYFIELCVILVNK